MIVLEADQVARMQRRKDEEREAKECMLVNDIIFFFCLDRMIFVALSM
jgi:hypothetical protein